MDQDAVVEVVLSLKNELSSGISHATADIQGLAAKIQSIGAQQNSYLSSSRDSLSGISDVLGGVEGKLLGILGGVASIATVLEGIRGADQIRDLAASIDAVTQSSGEGVQAIAYFENEALRTRATATDLATFYREDFALAIKAGFNPDNLKPFLVELSQAATAVGVTAEQANEEINRVLAGQTRVRPGGFLSSIGITAQDLKDAGGNLDLIVKKIEAIAPAGEAMGQSLDSTWAHVKDSLTSSFAEGFNSARGSAEKGMEGVLAAIDSPDVKDALGRLGSLTATILENIGRGVGAIAAPFEFVVGQIEVEIGRILQVIGQGFEKAFDFARDAANKVGLTSAASGAGALASSAADLGGIGQGLVEQGNLNLSKSEADLAKAFSGTSAAIDHQTDSLKTGASGLEVHNAAAANLEKQLQTLEAAAVSLGTKVADSFTPKSISPFENELDGLRVKLSAVEQEIGVKLAAAMALPGEKAKDLVAYLSALSDAARLGEAEQEIAAYDVSMQTAAKDANDLLGQVAGLDVESAAFAAQGGDALDAKLASISKTGSDLITKIVDVEQTWQHLSDVAAAGGNPELAAAYQKAIAQADLLIPEIQKAILNQQALTAEAAKLAPQIELAKQAASELSSELSSSFQNIFDAIASGGLGGLKNALNSIFKDVTKNFGKDLVAALGLNAPNPNDPKYKGAGGQQQYLQDLNAYNTGPAGTIKTGLALASGAQQFYGLATTPGVSVGQGLLTGAGLGASIGSVVPAIGTAIGAVVGAVIGGIAAAISPSASKDYQYGLFGYTTQRGAFDYQTQNISQANLEKTLETIYTTVMSFQDKYVQMFAQLGPDFVAKLPGIIAGMAFGTDTTFHDPGAFIQSAASKTYMADLQNWLTVGLPGEINDAWWGPLSQGLATIGLSADKIAEIKTAANSMDPTAALDYLTKLVTAVTGMNKVLAQLGGGAQGDSFGSVGIGQAAYNAVHGSFVDANASTLSDLATMGSLLGDLSGPGQVDELQQMVDKSNAYYQSVLQYEEKIQAVADQLNSSIQSDLDKYTLAGMKNKDGTPDYGSQINYVDKEYNQALSNLRSAKTPDDVAKYEAQAQAFLDEIMGFASHGSQATQDKFNAWAIEQLNNLKAISDASLAAMGTAAEQQAKELEALMQPYVDAFKAATDALSNLAGTPTGGGGGGGGAGTGPKSTGGDFGLTPIDISNLADAYSQTFSTGAAGSTALLALGGVINGASATQTDRLIAAINANRGGDITFNVIVQPTGSGFQQSIKIARQ